ncbi:hypothetical protein AAP_03069 [Ascosphaera apis ARSEF 7405]|uniref:Uncharacterized protein n=1 Tax=Ascosphaera apis ARSEF 7405 TaxID=392613 RepID=A0A166NRA9_9EURO|nr:hypothetical protein AAP_03069 [Ascosphaera apis ARSEF 7405]
MGLASKLAAAKANAAQGGPPSGSFPGGPPPGYPPGGPPPGQYQPFSPNSGPPPVSVH